jgi:ribosomal protein L21E
MGKRGKNWTEEQLRRAMREVNNGSKVQIKIEPSNSNASFLFFIRKKDYEN